MARMERAVAPGAPHYVTQRGNRRQKVYFGDDDYAADRALLAEGCAAAGVAVWACCLMPNHVHLILVPPERDSLQAALAEAHRRYTRLVNRRHGWTGYLWQGRFTSCALDELHLLAAARYVEQNPVRARLVGRPRDCRWSSARAHLSARDDGLVRVSPLLDRIEDWAEFLAQRLAADERDAIRSGRPLGAAPFVRQIEKRLGRRLAKQKPGPKPKAAAGK